MDEQNAYCSNPVYRNAIALLATSVYHVSLETPDDDATQEEQAKYMKLVDVVEQQITQKADLLSKRFEVSILSVHADIHECINFLPKHDLLNSYFFRKNNRLN